MTGIYNIINTVNGKRYVGHTSNLRKRMNDHFSDLRLNRHGNKYLQRAFNKYGKKSFDFRVIEENLDESILVSQEQYWFDRFRKGGIQLYNVGDMVDNPFRGQHHSEETKKKLSFPMSDKTKLLLSIRRKGRKLSEEWKQHIRESCKGINTKTHCPQGHPKTVENTYSKSTCKICTLASNKRIRQRQRNLKYAKQ